MKKSLVLLGLLIALVWAGALEHSTAFPSSPGIRIYKGQIEAAAEYLAVFPTEQEASATVDRIQSILRDFESVLSGKKLPIPDEIEKDCRYILDVYRRTEILEWCLLTLCQNQSISLLPGEGITIDLPSYCLDIHAASPDTGEFFSLEQFKKKEGEWLLPLLDYAAKHAKEDLPMQSLIWNLQENVPYQELPDKQQGLLDLVFPDAEEKFGGEKPARKLLGAIKTEALDKLKDAVEIIDDAEEIASEISERKSKYRLLRPKNDAFQLDNGLLIRISSPGGFEFITLTIVNPKKAESGESGSMALPKMAIGSTAFFNGPFPVPGFVGKYGPVADIPGPPSSQKKFKKGMDWWKENSGLIQDASERGAEVVEIIQNYNEKGLDGVVEYTENKLFDASLDVFKSFHKGIPEVERAFEMFRAFNKDLMTVQDDKFERLLKEAKKFYASRWKYRPGRKDVQPLAARGGY
jgi:hypothetical protein